MAGVDIMRVEMLDAIGVPEYFSTHTGDIEDAGGGMVRVIRCIERHGVLVPVYSAVAPAESMLRTGPEIREFCLRMLKGAGARH